MDTPAVRVARDEVETLQARLAEAEDTLRAIRHGEVDALIIHDGAGDQIYTLRSADAPYRALVEQMQEGAVTVNVAGDIVYANRSFADFVAMPLERVIGAPVATFVDDADHEALRAALRHGAGALRTRVRGAGRSIDAHVSVNPITLDDAEHRTLIVTDLTTLTRVQRESQSKDEFLAILAHELRNPLAPIRTGLQVLRRAPGEDAAARVRDMMDRQVSQMVRLIDDLLDVSRVSSGKIELKRHRVDLQSVVGLAVETSGPALEAGRHQFSLHLPPTPLWVDADPVRLAQVFSNLLNNAAKYTPDGGRIALVAAREDGIVRVEVRDDGVGIAADTLPDVFEMFSQVGRNLDRSQGGLGIGLTLVRRLTEMHGGSVEAVSAGLGHGSTFIVRVPLLPGPAGHDAPLEGARRAPPSPRRLKVLVVDDNLDGAGMLAMLVAMHGHGTALAHDGVTALATIASFAPDLVFCDIGLPGLDGYKMARQVRAAEAARGGGARVMLVSLTGWGSDDDRRRAREAGFDRHLTKPIDAKEVEALLARVGQAAPQ